MKKNKKILIDYLVDEELVEQKLPIIEALRVAR